MARLCRAPSCVCVCQTLAPDPPRFFVTFRTLLNILELRTWGNEDLGGNSFELLSPKWLPKLMRHLFSRVRLSYDLSSEVAQVYGNGAAFAALKVDGSAARPRSSSLERHVLNNQDLARSCAGVTRALGQVSQWRAWCIYAALTGPLLP